MYSILKLEESTEETTLTDGKVKQSLFSRIRSHLEELQLLQFSTYNFLATAATKFLKLCLPTLRLLAS